MGSDHGSAAQMFPNKGVDNITILKSVEQRRQAFGLVVQRKHRLVNQSKGATARFSQHSSLGDPVLEKCQLHRLRPICPEVVSNRISMCLGSKNVRVDASGFSCAVEAHICRKKKNIRFCRHKSQGRPKKFDRLTLQGLPKTLDFLKKELLGICSL
jgi:hypothetical protein